MNKPRYWHVAYPLVVTTLCVAPHEYFLKHWQSCFEVGLAKLKVRDVEQCSQYWTNASPYFLGQAFQNNCHERHVTLDLDVPIPVSRIGLCFNVQVGSPLEALLPGRPFGYFPADDHLECLVYIVHFILSRFFEYGRELTLSLLQEQSIRSLPPSVNLTQHLAPERSTIALEAILRSLYLVEKEESTPSWPSNSDFSTPPSKDDYPTLSTFCPPSFMTKPGMQEYFDRCGAIVAAIASSCAKSVGRMSVFGRSMVSNKVEWCI